MQLQNEAGTLLPNDGTQVVPIHLIRGVALLKEAWAQIDEQHAHLEGLDEESRSAFHDGISEALSYISSAEEVCCNIAVGIQIKRLGGPSL